MKHHFLFVRASLLLFVLAMGSREASAEKYRLVQLEGFPITISLEKRVPNQQAEWPAEAIVLTTKSVAVTRNTTIHELLRANHIFPDVEAFSVVYALNPEVKKLSEPTVQQIVIPRIQNDESLQPFFNKGFFVYLTIYKEEKEKFTASVRDFRSLAATTLGFAPARFPDQASQAATFKSLTATQALLNGMNKRILQRFGPPITRSALNQLNGDLELLNEVLNKKVSSAERFDQTEQELVLAIEKDVRIKGRMFAETAAGQAPDAWDGLVSVSVQTLNHGQQEVTGLRIYFVPEAQKSRRNKWQPFGKLTPTNEKLEEADYYFWATRDSDPTHAPITNEVLKEIRKDKGSQIQLTVIR